MRPTAWVVAKLDRLSRSLIDLARLLQWFREMGAPLIAVDVGLDTSTATGALVADVVSSIAGWDRETIADRTRAELAARRAQGRPVSGPAVADYPELAERIRAMREDESLTLKAIADRLNAEGVPTLRGGKAWRSSSVQAATGYRRGPQRRRAAVELPAMPAERISARWPRPFNGKLVEPGSGVVRLANGSGEPMQVSADRCRLLASAADAAGNVGAAVLFAAADEAERQGLAAALSSMAPRRVAGAGDAGSSAGRAERAGRGWGTPSRR